MKVELRPYPTYHTARVSWAKTIPLDWETGWLGECSTTIQTGPFGSQLHTTEYVSDGIPVINPSNIVQGCVAPDWEITVDDDKATALRRHRFKLGDIVFARRGEMGRCAPIRAAEIGWLCGTGSMLVRLKSHRLLPEFAALLLSQAGVRDTLSLESVGATMDNLNTRILAKIRIPVPPIQDQQAILAFLDRETAKIDRLMAVRRKQVERLQEQRTAVIHHAVTKGLDPQPKMKPSGVAWLGDVNSDWHSFDIKHLAEVIAGGTPKSSESDFWDGSVVWVTPTDLGKGSTRYVNASLRTITPLGQSAAGLTMLPAASLVMSTRAPVGSMSILGVPATTNQGCKGIVFDEYLADSRFFFYVLSLAVPFLNAVAQGATFVELSGFQLKNVKIVCPSVEIQKQIADWLDAEMERFENLFAKYQRELDLLAEYRASLISHAVTGKIDVRGLV